VLLTVKAELETVLDFEPRQVNFGTVSRGQGATRTVKLVGPDAPKTKLLSATVQPARSGQVRATRPEPVVLARLGQGAQAGTVELSLAPDIPSGRFYGQLMVRTDHPKVPVIHLRVLGTVQGAVALRPERVVFSNAEDGRAQTRTLVLRSTTDEPVRVLEINADHPALTATASQDTSGRTRVNVTWNGTLQGDREVATLVILTSSPEEPRIEVPVEMHRLRRQAVGTVRPADRAKR
jgi:hypothetical protein